MKNNRLLIFLAILCVQLGTFAQVIFSEIMYDLPDPGGDTGREWIEIQNVGNDAVDITGWKFFEGDTNHNLVLVQGSSVLIQGAFAVIADKPDMFLVEYPRFSGTLFDSAFSLNNTAGEKLALKNASSTVVSEVSYTPLWGAKGNGDSLQYFVDGWSGAVPTPGAVNVKSIPKPKASVSVPVQEPTVKKEVPQTKQNESVSPVEEVLSLDTPGPVILDISDAAFSEDSSRLVWWLLLGGVIVVASLTYWIGGRRDPDEYTIIEEKSSE